MDMKGFTKAAQAGVVTVEFNKIDTGELRVMPCTLNVELSGHNVPEILEQREDNDHLVVWCLDKQGWRSFRTETVITWYEGRPEKD
tara:strand:- start:3178 stop:3435 length:258 start_codon:yes stop_codon:yes gene_type:complete